MADITLIIGLGDVEARMHLAYKSKHICTLNCKTTSFVRYIHKVISINKHLLVTKNCSNTFIKEGTRIIGD